MVGIEWFIQVILHCKKDGSNCREENGIRHCEDDGSDCNDEDGNSHCEVFTLIFFHIRPLFLKKQIKYICKKKLYYQNILLLEY